MKRCPWAKSELMQAYHDAEWGVPVHDDVRLFEFLILEGAQAGLSWETVLKKREAYREAFEGFDPAIVAKFNTRKVESLLRNEGIIRNRLKVESSVVNAKAFLAVQQEFGSFDRYAWGFTGEEGNRGTPRVNKPTGHGDVPATSPDSDAFSKALQKRGFKFVGSTIVYAYMQATGMVNDHVVGCAFRRA